MVTYVEGNICLVTHHPFWGEPLGCGTLIRARYDLLKKICKNVYVLYITTSDNKCPLPGGTLKLNTIFRTEDLSAIKEFLKNQNISTCYFSYDQFGFLTEFTECKNIVEIHDVMHLREAQFNKFGYEAPYQVTKDDEMKSLQRYDNVLSLNLNEVTYLKENGIANAMYLPPNLPFNNKCEISSNGSFGLIGSMAKPNLDGLGYLDVEITSSEKFVLAGPISMHEEAGSRLGSHVRKLGIIENPASFYNSVEVTLSPIRFGGGLKIKVFEALSFGKPVLATKHSIDGFPENIEDVVTVIDDIASWKLDTIEAASKVRRADIKDFFVSNFNDQLCIDTLREVLSCE